MCTRPDPEFPQIVCGYPLPCPHHTLAVVDVARGRITNVTGDEKVGRRLGAILDALKDAPKPALPRARKSLRARR